MIKYENTDTLPETVEKNKINIFSQNTQVKKNKQQIEKNKKKISSSNTEIDKNKKNISNNKSEILVNKSEISANKIEILANKENIKINKSFIESNDSKILNNKITSLNNKQQINDINKVLYKKQQWIKFGEFTFTEHTKYTSIHLTDQQVEFFKNKHFKIITNNIINPTTKIYLGAATLFKCKEDNTLSSLNQNNLLYFNENAVFSFELVTVVKPKNFSLTFINNDFTAINKIYIYTLEDV